MELLVRLDRVQAFLLRDLLGMHGIKAHVLNVHMQGAMGEIPADAAMPQVWLDDARDRTRATALLKENEAARHRTGRLFCRGCGEENPATFELCWNCGANL
jgi:hypothetical protein